MQGIRIQRILGTLVTVWSLVWSHDPTIYLKETFPHTKTVDGYKTLVVQKDNDCLMPCVIDKKPKGVPLQWVVQMHNNNISIPISTDTETQNSFKYQLDKPATNVFRLKIQNTQVSDEGLYICRVQLHNFQFANVSRMIKVIQKPQIIDIFTSSDMLKEEGDQAELTCQAEGIPKPLISWERAGGGILPSGGREFVSPSIQIDQVSRAHKGTYKCIAKNIAGVDVRRITLDVKFTPEVRAKEREVFQAVGYSRELKCEVSGNPAPSSDEVMWYKEGTAVIQGDKYDTETYVGSNYILMKLRVKNIQQTDYGRYTCYAENSQGNGQNTVLLSKTTEYVSDRVQSSSGCSTRCNGLTILLFTWYFLSGH